MKKFVFSLDKVLDYKEQLENSLRGEYALAMDKVRKQEQKIDQLKKAFSDCCHELEQKKIQGCTVSMIVSYDGYLNSLRKQQEKEEQFLVELRAEAERKRKEMVAAKVETSSFEKLKEKKLKEYEKEATKKEEQFIEEFVSNTTAALKKNLAAAAAQN